MCIRDRALAAGAMLLALTACGAPGEDALDELREDMTAADGVTVRAAVTSTAGGEYAEYGLECTRSGGEYGVTVLAPAEVAGVTATLDLDEMCIRDSFRAGVSCPSPPGCRRNR